jgi:N,N'-diacetyllegionaminate synthase
MRCLVIAEAGVNHNGDIELAKQLVDEAYAAGADYIKFQTFKAENLVTAKARKAEYQERQTGSEESQYSMLKRLELSYRDFVVLNDYCKVKGISFLSTPFDNKSIEFLDKLGMDVWKIPSGEVTNYPYLVKIAGTHKPIIMSTGMCTMDDVNSAIQVLNSYGCGPITLLHCTTEYPAPYSEANLKAMETLRSRFNLPVGYSDHTQGIVIPIAAVAMGAVVLEKHFTLDRTMEGPDHKASLDPGELKAMVDAIRCVESSMGDGVKGPTDSERRNMMIARKSIVAMRPIRKGERFTTENITTKRPGSGISPMRWNEVLGQCAKRSFEEDELIEV